MSSTSSVCAAVPLISAAARGVAARPSTRRLAPRSRSSASARSRIPAGGAGGGGPAPDGLRHGPDHRPALVPVSGPVARRRRQSRPRASRAPRAWRGGSQRQAARPRSAPRHRPTGSGQRSFRASLGWVQQHACSGHPCRVSASDHGFRHHFFSCLAAKSELLAGPSGKHIHVLHVLCSMPVASPSTMNFDLTAEHHTFAESVSRFAKDHLAPAALARAHAATYPWETAALLARQGLLGITLPEADGGQGGSLMHAVLAIEQVALVCPRSADIVQAGNFGALRTFAEYASAEQKARFLPDLLAGRTLMALAMTEPDAGSAATDLKTSARPDGEHYVINGAKLFSTHSPEAALFLV